MASQCMPIPVLQIPKKQAHSTGFITYARVLKQDFINQLAYCKYGATSD